MVRHLHRMPDPVTALAPLVVTLTLDDAAQGRFDDIRRRYFPPERLHVGAHVTMFHALPGDREISVKQAVASACACTPPFPVAVVGLRSLGHGVAYELAAEPAIALRRRLLACFCGGLTPQDRGRWQPHVTVQNKVTPEIARNTKALLARLAFACPVTATGVAVWRYRGGPWEAVARYAFAGPTAEP